MRSGCILSGLFVSFHVGHSRSEILRDHQQPAQTDSVVRAPCLKKPRATPLVCQKTETERMTKAVLRGTKLSEEKRLLGLCLCLDNLESWTRSQANRAPWTCLNTAWEGLKNNKQTGKTMSIWWQASEHVAAVEWLVAVKSPLKKTLLHDIDKERDIIYKCMTQEVCQCNLSPQTDNISEVVHV